MLGLSTIWWSKVRAGFVAAAALILSCQLFLPPIVGLADQGDFGRLVGRFGFRAADGSVEYGFLTRRFVPDLNARQRPYEQINSEYIFAGAAALLNKVLSKDGSLDLTLIGLVHVLAFLYAFHRVLQAIPPVRWGFLVWMLALLILTDVGYVAYWNSFYAEPASCIFFLLLLAESIAICRADEVSSALAVRWALWGILFVMAKPQNAPVGILLALLALRLRTWSKSPEKGRIAIGSSLAIAAATAFIILKAPLPNQWSSTYDQVFMAILPESKNPARDAQALGLPADWLKYSGTGAWTQRTNFYEGVRSGLIGKTITHGSIIRFYALRPARIWRRAKRVLPVAFSLRPEFCGNFEQSAGRPPNAKSQTFNLWSRFHWSVLEACGKLILIALLVCPAISVAAWFRWPSQRRIIEFFGVLGLSCLLSFLVAICGDAWDNVKHLFLFNLLLDTWIVAGIAILFQFARKVLYGI
jgi:hypothetical protein